MRLGKWKVIAQFWVSPLPHALVRRGQKRAKQVGKELDFLNLGETDAALDTVIFSLWRTKLVAFGADRCAADPRVVYTDGGLSREAALVGALGRDHRHSGRVFCFQNAVLAGR